MSGDGATLRHEVSGDRDAVRRVTIGPGERLACGGGMPSDELVAQACRGAGVDRCSSAAFASVPATARAFPAVSRKGDMRRASRRSATSTGPSKVRDRKVGYMASASEAGIRLRGFAAGPVRPPLSDLTEGEENLVADLIRNRP